MSFQSLQKCDVLKTQPRPLMKCLATVTRDMRHVTSVPRDTCSGARDDDGNDLENIAEKSPDTNTVPVSASNDTSLFTKNPQTHS